MTGKQNKLARDLTLVLMRSNGSPRAFRIRVPALTGSLLTLSGTIAVLGLGTIGFIAVLLWHNHSFTLPRIRLSQGNAPTNIVQAPNPEPTPDAAAEDTSKQPLDAIPAPESVLREELVKVQKELEGRKSMGVGSTPAAAAANGPLMLMPANSTPIPANEVYLEIKNVRASRVNGVPVLDFDLQNTHPTQQQVRGYITVVAKTASGIFTYPEQVLSPKDNILLNFGRGETFALSRFRQAAARFPKIPTDISPIYYQIILFAPNGKIIQTSHAEGK